MKILSAALFCGSCFLFHSATGRPSRGRSSETLQKRHQSLPPLIALEEHFISQAFLNSPFKSKLFLEHFTSQIINQLKDLDQGRIHNLDSTGIATQVISHAPTLDVPPADLCPAANNELAAAISRHRGRLAGFATLPMLDPAAAAKELERCVRDLGFLGTLIPHQSNGRYYDDAFFWPVFEKAQELDAPVYLHPTWPYGDQASHYAGNYSSSMETTLSSFGYGWHVDTGLSFLRAWAGGVFDKFPNLKMILGHMGEGLPFWLDRSEPFLDRVKEQRQRSLNDVWYNNLWVTTSGQFTLTPFSSVMGRVNASRIMFSVDYPISPNQKGENFMKLLRDSHLVNSTEFEMIANGNAKRLLRI